MVGKWASWRGWKQHCAVWLTGAWTCCWGWWCGSTQSRWRMMPITADRRKGRRQSTCQTKDRMQWYGERKAETTRHESCFSPSLCGPCYCLLLHSLKTLVQKIHLNPKNFPESFHRKLASLPPQLTSCQQNLKQCCCAEDLPSNFRPNRPVGHTLPWGSLRLLCTDEAGALGFPQPLPAIFSAGVDLTRESQKRGFPQVKLAALQKFRCASLWQKCMRCSSFWSPKQQTIWSRYCLSWQHPFTGLVKRSFILLGRHWKAPFRGFFLQAWWVHRICHMEVSNLSSTCARRSLWRWWLTSLVWPAVTDIKLLFPL